MSAGGAKSAALIRWIVWGAILSSQGVYIIVARMVAASSSGDDVKPVPANMFWILVAVSVVIATSLGTLVPFACLRLKIPWFGRRIAIDPALAAGPFITTLNDIISTTIALLLSTSLAQDLAGA